MTGSSSTAPEERQRIASLDGLRGLAALAVVVCHALISTSFPLANPYVAEGYGGHFPDLSWFLVHTPLHAFWDGQEAVLVFFVLSGYVLCLPVAFGQRFTALSYYPKRFVRLYVPVWAAIIVGYVAHIAVAHKATLQATWWLNNHQAHPTWSKAWESITMVNGAGDWAFVSPLWSLQWEVLFSMFLPGFLLLGLLSRRRPWLAVVLGVAALALVWHFPHGAGRYLPVFLIGSIMAFHQDALGACAGWLRRRPPVAWLVGALAVAGLSAAWWVPGGMFGSTTGPARAMSAVGAMLVVGLAVTSQPFGAFLVRPRMRWLGKRSFSLYLVHEPLLVALAFALGAHPAPAAFLVLAVPVALGAAAIFYRLVELPSHELSRRVGRAGARLSLRLRGAGPMSPAADRPRAVPTRTG